MPLPGNYSPIDIKPLTGFFDVRSSPDAVAPGTWRWRQNVQVLDKDGLCRRQGWSRLFDKPNYNNEDLHDQLTGLQEFYADRAVPHEHQGDITVYPPGVDSQNRPFCSVTKDLRTTGRQPLTFLFPATTTGGERKLLAGTQNRIYALDESRGNWKILADGYGGTPTTFGVAERRWSAAQVADTVVFVNGFDPPLFWPFDGPTFGCDMQAVAEIDDLAEIGVTKASVVFSWKGTIFLGDVEMDGVRAQQRLVWSDFEGPTSFIPSNASTSGFQDLSPNERILAGKPLGDVCLIYTTKGIWEMTFVGGAAVYSFRSVYSEPENGAGCLAYRFTLASTGDEHVYLGRDGIYAFNLYLPRPERVEWMHAASGEIFATIDSNRCDSHTAWFDPSAKEYWVSWIEHAEGFPIRSLVFNTRYHSNDIVDHGFTAGCIYQPDTRPTVLQWLLDNLICLRSELEANEDLLTRDVKAGGFCSESILDCESVKEEILTVARDQELGIIDCTAQTGSEEPLTLPSGEYLTTDTPNADSSICTNRNLPIWTNTYKDIDGLFAEDPDAAGDADSLCSLLGATVIESICHECEPEGVLVLASATDWCLKQYGGGIYYRERVINCAPCLPYAQQYQRDPYDSILRTGALDFGHPRENKQVRSLNVEFETDSEQAIPSALQTRIGYASQAVDPNKESTGSCALVWRDLKPKDLICQSDRSGPDHVIAGTRPNRALGWHFLYTGHFFYLELKVSGINGAVCFSRLSMEARQRPRSITSGA